MDNLTLNLQQNWTQGSGFNSCIDRYQVIDCIMNFILLFLGFPSTVIIIAKLLIKMNKTRNISAAEAFLLQINFTNIFVLIAHMLSLLSYLNVIEDIPVTLYTLFYSPSFTARPVFLLGMCVIINLAIVHPVTFMASKTWFHWEWLVITLVWIYTLAVNVVSIYNEYYLYHPVFTALLLISLPINIYFNVTTVKALISRGPGNDGQTLNPAKRKAFRIVLSIQVVLLMFYVPEIYLYIHLYLGPITTVRFMCAEGLGLMLLSQVSEFVMPVIFLYSLSKLGV